jgi:hypothetical protein
VRRRRVAVVTICRVLAGPLHAIDERPADCGPWRFSRLRERPRLDETIAALTAHGADLDARNRGGQTLLA